MAKTATEDEVGLDPGTAQALTVAMAMEPYVRDLVLAAFDDAVTGTRLREVQLAMRSRRDAEVFAKGLSRTAAGILRPRLDEALVSVASQAVPSAMPKTVPSPTEVRKASRPPRPPRMLSVVDNAAAQARRFSAKHLTGVTNEAAKAVRTVVTNGLMAGLTPAGVAANLRDRIGLTERQQQAVTNYEAGLKTAGKLPAGQRKAAVTTYANSLKHHRAEVIARTEVMYALNAGRLATWKAYQANGVISPDAMKQWWTAEDERTCDICAPMHGVAVRLMEDFTLAGRKGEAISLPSPPPHPQCRCIVQLTE